MELPVFSRKVPLMLTKLTPSAYSRLQAYCISKTLERTNIQMHNCSGRMINGLLFAALACVVAMPARAVVVTFDVTGTFGNTCTPTGTTTHAYSGTGGSVSLKYFAPVTFSQDVHQY